MLGTPEGCSIFLAEPCGLKDTHDTVLHARQAVISTPNERVKTRERHFACSKICPSGGLFRKFFEPKTIQVRKEDNFLLFFETHPP